MVLALRLHLLPYDTRIQNNIAVPNITYDTLHTAFVLSKCLHYVSFAQILMLLPIILYIYRPSYMAPKRSGDGERGPIHSLQAIAEYMVPVALNISKISILEALEQILLHASNFGLVHTVFESFTVHLLHWRLESLIHEYIYSRVFIL